MLSLPGSTRPVAPVLRAPEPVRFVGRSQPRAKIGTGFGRRARREGSYAADPRAGRTGPGRSRTGAQRRTPWRGRASHARTSTGLTARERQVLELLAEGLTNRRIANSLFITEKTVSVHVTHILEKLQVTNRSEAGAIARGHGKAPPRAR